jgi:hypothetical protein
MKKNTSEHKSLRLAFIFCALVVIASSIAMIFKGVAIMKSSIYDSSHRFTLYIQRTPLTGEVLSLDPQTKTLSRVFIVSKALLSSPSTLFGIPIDADVSLEGNTSTTYGSTSGDIFDLLFKKHSSTPPLTDYDILRLGLLARSISPESTKQVQLALPIDPQTVDTQLDGLFTDQAMIAENKTIAVVNSSGGAGVGGRVERVLTQMGLTVISVTTGREDVKESHVEYRTTPTYTAEKLSKLFHFPLTKMTDEYASDITIIIGENDANSEVF